MIAGLSILFALFAVLICQSTAANTEAQDAAYLIGFMNGIVTSTPFTNWDSLCTPCTIKTGCSSPWYGVTCTGTKVTQLDLSNLKSNLGYSYVKSGAQFLGQSIGGLTDLIYLDLSANDVSDTLPSQIFTLSALKTLKLNGNSLTGSIPLL